jgi:subtilase family serine protease
MGALEFPLDEANGWGIGTRTLRSSKTAGRGDGDYDLTFEIRSAPLPDLRPTAIRLFDSTGDACLVVQNAGTVDSSPFRMTLYVDGALAAGGNVGPAMLAAGETNGVCKAIPLPASGGHRLALVVDEERAVPELNEHNNRLEQDLDRIRLGEIRPQDLPDLIATDPDPNPGSGGPTILIAPRSSQTTGGPLTIAEPLRVAPAPGQGQADLTVSAIRVRGAEPTGASDCDPGENDVTVMVKNTGTVPAAGLVVALVVDNGARREATLASVEAGKETSVRFDKVRLARGERRLMAVADATKIVVESNEDNNELKQTVRCKNDKDNDDD